MIKIKGNSTKSKIYLDEEFDEITLQNTLTEDIRVFSDLTPSYRGGLYYLVMLDFSGLELGEYKYEATLKGKRVQTGLLVIEPFDESEEPVQIVTPNLSRDIITYQSINYQ